MKLVGKGTENNFDIHSDSLKESSVSVEKIGDFNATKWLHSRNSEGRATWLIGSFLFKLYRFSRGSIRRVIRKIVLDMEGGSYFSFTIRRIFSTYHKVDVGMYSSGGCFVPFNFRLGTRIGRYCSVYDTVQAFDANHPMNTKSTNALFYNPQMGFAEKDLLTRTKLSIGNDVFMGHNAIILPAVSEIGDGAIIGAGSVVHQDVPPYAVMVGHPARVVRYRFSEETIQQLLESRWWDKSFEELKTDIKSFQHPLEGSDKIR